MSLHALAYIIWDINPDIFIIPIINHPLRWYGLFFALAFLVSQQIMYFIYKKDGRPVNEVDTLTAYMVVATIVGARLGHVLFYDPQYYFQNPHKILMIWEGGLASHGGVISVIVASWLFARKTRVSYLWILDRISIVAAFVFCMIRLGNLMNSEMIGIPTNLPWGFIFTSRDNIPRHPAQLYEAIHYLISFIVLFWVWFKLKEKMKNGFVFSWALIIMFSFRFIDEFFKMNQVQFEDGMIFNMGQLLSIPFILIGIVILISGIGKKQETILIETIMPDREQ
ncbi:MAG TPA: prolipoprotein diacylglyceryl transferase [Cyclobacteriaceae bacterium]|nr:prolipoprotein diacylglyceryl transferase [Cyclobacteriaceae bacterium]